MANNKQSIKRVSINRTKNAQNTMRKSALKTQIKKCKAAIETGASDKEQVFSETASAIDKAAAKHLIHRNTAARRKSKLARSLKKSAAS